MLSSTPTISEFRPLAMQLKVIRDIRNSFDYSKGTHEVLLSGSVGSSKSILLAHIIVTHCLANANANFGIGRLTLPSLKDTLLDVILKHIGQDIPIIHNQVKSQILFPNGSKINSFSWADKNYKKFRSHEFSGFAVEELTENKSQEFYDEMITRVGRLNHVNEKIVINATNPDSPDHWAYKRFITNDKPNVHVYYSKTAENPYLPASYIRQIEETLDPKMARRMLYGEWIEINQEVVYYSYQRDHNFKDVDYKINTAHDIHISYDFNIGFNKPISAVMFQYIGGVFHFFDESVIHSANTEQSLDDIAGRGLLDHDCVYIINGDATGRARHTSSNHSDYEIIRNYLDRYRTKKGQTLRYKMEVPLSNPRVRDRHNTCNAIICNARGERRVLVYRKAKTLDEGLRLTKLKQGADYVEDDSKPYQHICTGFGYGIIETLNQENREKNQIQRIRR